MYYEFRRLGAFDPGLQIIVIAALFVVTTVLYYREYKTTGKMATFYPARVSMALAPIYEEIIFRGFILFELMKIYSPVAAIIISSLLFGIWHFKNIFFMPPRDVAHQMFYTGVIFGPAMALITLFTGTVWLAVIFHYANNMIAPLSRKFGVQISEKLNKTFSSKKNK